MDSAKLRRFDIDWLRVIAIFVIFLLHVGCIFDTRTPIPYILGNTDISLELIVLNDFFILWAMPLFFILSGAGTYYALGFRRPLQYIQERARRILIPFIFGVLVIVPPMIYLYPYYRVSNYLEFYLQYVERLSFFGSSFLWYLEIGYHLWYLLLLFIYSVITLPLFIYLRKETGKRIILKLAFFFKKPVAIFLLAFPIMILEVLFPPGGIGVRVFGGWNIFTYFICFIYGYLIFSNSVFQSVIKRYWKISLVLGLITFVILKNFPIYFSSTYMQIIIENLNPVLSVSFYELLDFIEPLFWGLRALSSWFWIIALLGFGSLYLNRTNRFLKYANEAVLPFYILHLTVILIVGYYVIEWNTGVNLKFLIISIISFSGILAIYGLIIRPFRIMRFLFGMKPRKLD